MLKRIYIDNFRCFVNFELSVDSINLFLGPNGAGKSTVFDVLRKIQAFVGTGHTVDAVFKTTDLTRWQKSQIQTFEIEIEGNEGIYKYELAIEHDKTLQSEQPVRVYFERLWFDNKPLYKLEKPPRGSHPNLYDAAQLYHDDHSKFQTYPLKRSTSTIALMPSLDRNTRLIWFRECIKRLIIVQIDPLSISGLSDRQENQLSGKAENFVSWYRHVSQDQDTIFKITETLREILDGFSHLKFEEFSEQRSELRSYFSTEDGKSNPIEYRFNELSDGQRVLIILYTLIHYARSKDYTLCIDEPENFMALSEIQPWLTLLYDLCDEGELQTLLISHHPNFIDRLAAYIGYWFERESNRPVRVKRIIEDNEGGIPISQLVERGWLYG